MGRNIKKYIYVMYIGITALMALVTFVQLAKKFSLSTNNPNIVTETKLCESINLDGGRTNFNKENSAPSNFESTSPVIEYFGSARPSEFMITVAEPILKQPRLRTNVLPMSITVYDCE